jgi:uncharacterized membrane protein
MHAALNLVNRVGRQTTDPELRARLRTQVDLLLAAFEVAGQQEHDVSELAEHAAEVSENLVG